jgi:hypothetical protein
MFEGLLCCGIPFAIAGVIFWLWRSWSMRGFRSAIAMDGATCLKADDGSVVIRRHTARNWIVLTVLLGLGLPLIGGILWAIIRTLLNGIPALGEALGIPSVLSLAITVGIIIGAGVLTLARLLRLAPVYFHADSEMLEVGRGSSLRQIPFSSISRVVIRLSGRGSMGRHETGAFGIGVVLEEGEILELGTVSGEMAKTAERAGAIAQLIAGVTGTPMAQPTSDGPRRRPPEKAELPY